jgi:hypothetical protein
MILNSKFIAFGMNKALHIAKLLFFRSSQIKYLMWNLYSTFIKSHNSELKPKKVLPVWLFYICRRERNNTIKKKKKKKRLGKESNKWLKYNFYKNRRVLWTSKKEKGESKQAIAQTERGSNKSNCNVDIKERNLR